MSNRCIGLLAVLILSAWTASRGAERPDLPWAEARAGLERYLSVLPPDGAALYGLPSNPDPAGIDLGEPFKIFLITPAALSRWTPGTSLASLLEETDTWWFPVRVQGHTAALLRVERVEETWRAVSFGLPGLAAPIARVEQQWAGNPEGPPQWIMIPQAAQLLYHVPGQPSNNLTQASNASAPDPASLTTAQEILPTLRQTVARNIAAYRANVSESSP